MPNVAVAARIPPSLVLVTGPPGAGKSTLGPLLARRLAVPCISRDVIHDLVFDGWVPTHPMFLAAGTATGADDGPTFEEVRVNWDLFLMMLGAVAPWSGVVGETPINHEINRVRLLELRDALRPVPMVEVFLHGDPSVLLHRVERRAADPTSHPIKVHFTVEGARRLHAAPYLPLLGADDPHHLAVDTTDLDAVPIDDLADAVVRLLEVGDSPPWGNGGRGAGPR